MVSKVFTDMFLGIAACLDYRRMKIPLMLPLIGSILGIAVFFIWKDRNVWDLLLGIIPGSLMVLIAFLTNEKVGYGDGMMLLALGMLLPAELCVMSFCVSLVLEAVTGLALLVFGKVTGKSYIPFLPFLLLGYVVMLGVCE